MKSEVLSHRQEASYFTWKGILIQQKEPVFKIGTDALLLGGWVANRIHVLSDILDVGTGTGVIAIMLGHAFPNARITGIDSAPEAVLLAKQNFAQTGWGDRIRARSEDISAVSAGAQNQYDVVVSNPPFFTEGEASAHVGKALARHLDKGIANWVKGLCDRTRPAGHIFIIVPFDAAFNWITCLNTAGYFVHERMDVKSFLTDAAPVRALLHFTHELISPHNSQLIMRDSTGRYTVRYLDLTGLQTAGK